MSGSGWRRTLVLPAALCVLALLPGGAHAAGEGSIDHADTRGGQIRVLYSIPALPPGVQPDLETLSVTVNGTPVEAAAEPAASASAAAQVRRTTVMAIDTSASMTGAKFAEAKAAAAAFLSGAPSDVYVGIVAFAGDVSVVQEPTLDRDAAAEVLDGLTLTRATRLYDGVIAAVAAAGKEGQRSLLVLSDGRDTSQTKLQSAVGSIAAAEVRVDVVVLGGNPTDNAPLEAMASQGKGGVFTAEDPAALTSIFNDEAAALARQILVTAPVPEEASGTEGSLAVSMEADGETYSDTAFVSFGTAAAETPVKEAPAAPLPVDQPRFQVTDNLLLAGIAALGLGLLVVLLSALGVFGKRDKETVEDKISAYTRAGAARNAQAAAAARMAAANGQSKGVAESAVDLAQRALAGNKGIEAGLGTKLDGANISLKPAEWLLLHASIGVVAGALGFLLSSGGLLLTVLFLVLGLVLPWLYLGIRKSRRLKAFNGQLAETLQLIAGSLSAGLSLAQSLDTVVREGSDPIAGEFRRALIEARLGVQVEDSLDSIAKRMESADFEWVVMAIRIQREVGGNLSELLLKVAGTMREREYLRRQVKTLSAEGKLSAWILGGLPPIMLVYMMLTNPSYLNPLLTTPLGWAMLAAMVVLMVVGSFWMSRVVKVDI